MSMCTNKKNPTEYLKLEEKKPLIDYLDFYTKKIAICPLFFFFPLTEQADFLCKGLHQITVIQSSSKQKEQRLNRIRKVCKGESGKIVGVNFLFQREL